VTGKRFKRKHEHVFGLDRLSQTRARLGAHCCAFFPFDKILVAVNFKIYIHFSKAQKEVARQNGKPFRGQSAETIEYSARTSRCAIDAKNHEVSTGKSGDQPSNS
jgi:hypothetical protein